MHWNLLERGYPRHERDRYSIRPRLPGNKELYYHVLGRGMYWTQVQTAITLELYHHLGYLSIVHRGISSRNAIKIDSTVENR